MNWNKLKQNKCPVCGMELVQRGTMIGCIECDFRITENRMNEIVASMVAKQIEFHEPDRNNWD